MTENETVSIWNKTAADLTVADQLKVSAVFVAVSVAVPVAFFGTIAAVESVRDRIRMRKLDKAKNTVEVVN